MDQVLDRAVPRDTPTLTNYLNDMNGKLEQVKSHVCVLQEHNAGFEAAVDMLELKNQLLLSYIIDLSYVVLIKCGGHGNTLQHLAAVDRLIEIRTMLEKIRPLEQKFSYHLDKLLRTASSSFAVGSEHPLQFKPVPENLVSKIVAKVESEKGYLSGEADVGENAGVYVPPRVVAMPYKENNRHSDLLSASRIEKSRLIGELRDELTDFPTEIQTSGGFKRRKVVDEDNRRASYEEEHMMRVTNRRKSHDLGRQHHEDLVDFPKRLKKYT